MDNMDNSDKRHMSNEISTRKLFSDGTAGHEDVKAHMLFVKSRNIIYYILGVIEVMLAFRFLFKLLGASTKSGFVGFLYSITGIFISPFSGIFNSYVTSNVAATYIFEPATIIGMLVYGIITWGLVRLIKLKFSRNGH